MRSVLKYALILAAVSGLGVVSVTTPITAGVSISIQPMETAVDVQETFSVFIWVDYPQSEFDGYNTVIEFDSEALEYISASQESVMTDPCGNTWWWPTGYSDSVKIVHTLMCGSGAAVTGPGALSSLTFKALQEGWTTISFKRARFCRAGVCTMSIIWHDGVVLVSDSTASVWIEEEADPEGSKPYLNVYSNPNSEFTMEFRAWVGRSGHSDWAALKIYDSNGRLVRDLWDGLAVGGGLRVHWDGNDGRGQAVPPGIYFLVFSGDSYEKTRKLVVVR